MRAIPPAAPIWHYTAGHLADCPFEHDDARFLRVFCQLDGDRGVCAFVRLAGERPAPRNSWRVESAQGSVVTVVR